MLKNTFLACLAIVIIALSYSCTPSAQKIRTIKKEKYELKIAPNQKAILIIFPCYPCDIEHTKHEAKFLENIEKEGITTLILNINQKLWLIQTEKEEYSKLIHKILDSNKVEKKNIFLGGFSSGGNVAVILANEFLKNKDVIQPKGVFVVDSPLDMEQLYKNAQKGIIEKASEDSYNESVFLTNFIEQNLGKPSENLVKFREYSPFLLSENSTSNMKYLKNIKVRFYTEPALEWQKKNRNRSYEELNAYVLEKAYDLLRSLGSHSVEFIKTENKGIRANGTVHPHSWSIVDKSNLLVWLKE
ncbi:MAG: hypothetical protein MUC49_14155 [Raineya sp.]|jgi:hypothetical protein|nr:hypothetical protein [Raineya sp.]